MELLSHSHHKEMTDEKKKYGHDSHHSSNAKERDDEKDEKEVTTAGSKSTHEEKDAPLFDELREFFLFTRAIFHFLFLISHPSHTSPKLAHH